MTNTKEIWCAVEKQGNKHLYTISTRDKKLHNTMVAAPDLLEALRELLADAYNAIDHNNPMQIREATLQKVRDAIFRVGGA